MKLDKQKITKNMKKMKDERTQGNGKLERKRESNTHPADPLTLECPFVVVELLREEAQVPPHQIEGVQRAAGEIHVS